jgi:hypothetical protein
VDEEQRIVALQGSAIKAGQSDEAKWLRAAPRLEESWQALDAPAEPCSSGFAYLYGTKEPSGLTSFMGAADAAATGTQWRVEGSKLSLKDPRAVGYQVRLSADGRVHAARFMFRSFAPPGGYPARQLSSTCRCGWYVNVHGSGNVLNYVTVKTCGGSQIHMGSGQHIPLRRLGCHTPPHTR